MTLTPAGWLTVALPLAFCAGVWLGVRLERAQQAMNREAPAAPTTAPLPLVECPMPGCRTSTTHLDVHYDTHHGAEA